MATSLLKLIPVFSLFVALLLPSLSRYAESADLDSDSESDQDYILDQPIPSDYLRRRILTTIKKGTTCDAATNNVCNGVSANNGTSILYCCKKHCRNVLGDRNNCGNCGNKCKLGELCCGGTCTNIAYSTSHCGKCYKACKAGQRCEYGFCGYA